MTGERAKVMLGLGQSDWEAAFVANIVSDFAGVDVRRCVDVSSLIVDATTSPSQLVIIDADFPRIDSTVVAALEREGARLVGVAADASGTSRLRALGVDNVVTVVPVDVGAAVQEIKGRWFNAIPGAGSSIRPQSSEVPAARAATGRLVAVWGPPGAPGRTSVALSLAQLVAANGTDVLLVDADTTAPGVSASLCLESDGSGLTAASHHGERGTLDPAVLARLARSVDDRFRVLTGISHVSRRAELRAAAMAKVWQQATSLGPLCVVDVGGCVDDGGLAFDADIADFGLNSGGQSAPVTALAVADELVAVTTCEPAAVARLLSHLGAIRSLAPAARIHVVINRVRSPLVRNSAAAAELKQFVLAQTRASDVTLVAEDRATFDQAILRGRTPFEQNRKSQFIADLTDLSRDVASPLLLAV